MGPRFLRGLCRVTSEVSDSICSDSESKVNLLESTAFLKAEVAGRATFSVHVYVCTSVLTLVCK